MFPKITKAGLAVSGAILASTFILNATAMAASQTKSPTSSANVLQVNGGGPWSPLAAAIGSNNTRASAFEINIGFGTDCLALFNFGFTIPAGATIDGIEVLIEGHSVGAATAPILVVGASMNSPSVPGTFSQTLNGILPLPAGPPDIQTVDGSPTDLWGAAWTPASINSATFGVDMFGTDNNFVGSSTYNVDDVRVVVYFTPAAAAPAATSTALAITVFLVLIVAGATILKRPQQTHSLPVRR